ncbi:hypothetical protein SLEP1_g26078 [Rubroshorea leprosula]|uniref:Uncharacterized protein n=1 Tax=Rubroshorea leprosula TaxID=152421 RepID=A0AAV5JYD3_9ROSI|nr:hypothetical protein SLEP1_g26078 [Rubroshorea leprosula]
MTIEILLYANKCANSSNGPSAPSLKVELCLVLVDGWFASNCGINRAKGQVIHVI